MALRSSGLRSAEKRTRGGGSRAAERAVFDAATAGSASSGAVERARTPSAQRSAGQRKPSVYRLARTDSLSAARGLRGGVRWQRVHQRHRTRFYAEVGAQR